MSDANTAMAQALSTAQGTKAANVKKPGKLSPKRVQQFQQTQARMQVSSPTLADVLRLTPNDDQIGNMIPVFGLESVDPVELTGLGSNMLRDQHDALRPVLVSLIRGEENTTALRMHLDRLVDGLVRSAYGSANFYESRRMIAKDARDQWANESRDADRMGIDGGENRVDGLRRIAAENGMKAYALACIASGACSAYAELIGEDWKPYQGKQSTRTLTQEAAALADDALGI